MAKRRDELTDACLRKIEGLRMQHGAPGAPMKQKTMARRSQQSYARVHRFLSGQMPYPPMDFLDAIFRSFGTTLADALKGSSEPPKQLPILREDVQEVADMLDDLDATVVEHVKGSVSLFSKAKSAGELIERNHQAPGSGKTKGAVAARAKRATRKG